ASGQTLNPTLLLPVDGRQEFAAFNGLGCDQAPKALGCGPAFYAELVLPENWHSFFQYLFAGGCRYPETRGSQRFRGVGLTQADHGERKQSSHKQGCTPERQRVGRRSQKCFSERVSNAASWHREKYG